MSRVGQHMYGVESRVPRRVNPEMQCKQRKEESCSTELWSSPTFKGVKRGETISKDVKNIKNNNNKMKTMSTTKKKKSEEQVHRPEPKSVSRRSSG